VTEEPDRASYDRESMQRPLDRSTAAVEPR
jgi:hypothetical protein